MMQVTGKVLAAQRFLNGMAAGHLDELATTAAEVVFPVGYRIFAEGGYADKFWLVESGHVAVTVQVPGEGTAVIANVGIGGPLRDGQRRAERGDRLLVGERVRGVVAGQLKVAKGLPGVAGGGVVAAEDGGGLFE